MLRKLILMAVIAVVVLSTVRPAEATPPGQPADWQRFYYYPYIYYPHTFQKPQQYDNMYYRYEPSMRIPVYNKQWSSLHSGRVLTAGSWSSALLRMERIPAAKASARIERVVEIPAGLSGRGSLSVASCPQDVGREDSGNEPCSVLRPEDIASWDVCVSDRG